MFILCPHCQFLVAIDPASGLPPARCPRCGQGLRAEEAPTTATEPPALAHAPSLPGMDRPAPAAADVEKDMRAQPDDLVAPTSEAPERTVDADMLGEMLVQAQTEADPPPADEPIGTPEYIAIAAAPASDDTPVDQAEARGPGSSVDVATPTPDPTRVPASPAPRRRTIAPSFARVPASADAMPVARRWPSLAALAALSLLLMLQVLLADRAQLAREARWRPAVATLCSVLHCSLPAWHEPEAFTLVARDVRPARPGVLRVTATFRNDARWTQAWPALHLALQDVDGGTIGARVFTPSEYRGGQQTQNGLAPGQVASISFDVVEPPGTVVAFTFDFR